MVASQARLPLQRFRSKAGQGVVEYILITAMIVGTVTGILYPLFQARLAKIQDKIQSETAAVVSQKTMGIPYCWFYCGSGGSFDDADRALAAADSARAASADAAASKRGDGTKDGKDKGKGDKGEDDKGGSGAEAGSASANRGSTTPSRKGSKGGSRRGGGGEGEDEEGPAGKRSETRNGSSGRGGGGGSSGTEERDPKKKKEDGKLGGEVGAEGEKEEGGSASLGKIRAQSRADEEKRGGCQSVNLFTLLKLAAIIAVIVIAGAVAITGRGRKGR